MGRQGCSLAAYRFFLILPGGRRHRGLDSSMMRLKKALSFTTLRISYRRLGLLVGRPLAKLNLPQTRVLHVAERL